MNKKMLTPILALGLILCLMAPSANAWEFSMDGTFTWLYEVRGQMGTNGFFGPNDQAEAPGANNTLVGGAYAPYNFYVGGYYIGRAGRGANPERYQQLAGTAPYGGRPYAPGQIVSGSDASWNTMYMLTNMQVRMNPAVRIRGAYYIGAWDNPNYSVGQGSLVAYEYLNMEAHGVQRSFSPGYWRTLWLTAQLPWGEIALGKRPSSWGMGLAFNGADNRSSESLALAAPFGPIRVQLSFYPSREAYMTDDYGTASGFYNERPDKNNRRVFDMTVPNITYTSGPLSAGVYANWMFRHRGGEARIENPTTRVNTATLDYSEWYGGAFFKYNNGRFFLNSEFQTLQATTKSSIGWGGQARFVIPPVDTEHYSGAVEAGVLAGPSKVSLIAAWFTGDDYRVGATVNNANQQFLYKTGRQPDTWSNTGVFRPYSYLMVYSYGLGQSFAKDTGNGYVSDASIYAGRLDYAVAANLNVFGSFMWAERFSKSGYTYGALRPAGRTYDDVDNTTGGQVILRNVIKNGGSAASIPTIPDTAIGWEIDAGFDWKLLEALTARCTLGYWVPGKWWNYATVDKNWNGWSNPYNGTWANNFMTRPDKTIDPIWGLEFKLEGTF